MTERLADCKAAEIDGLMICQRCGQQWQLEDPAPPACDPMTFKRMRARLVAEIGAAEMSFEIVSGLQRRGMPADPLGARRRLAELEALLRFFDRAHPSQGTG